MSNRKPTSVWGLLLVFLVALFLKPAAEEVGSHVKRILY